MTVGRAALLLAFTLPGCATGLAPAPAFTQRAEIRLPQYRRHTLDGGAELITYMDGSLPLVAISVGLRTEAADITPEQAGLDGLMYRAVLDGTEAMDASDLDDAFGALGAKPRAVVTQEGGYLTVTVAPEHAEAAVKLLATTLRRPRFAEGELRDRISRTVQREGARHPRVLATALVRTAVFGPDSSLGRPFAGTAATLSRLTRRDVVAFHERCLGSSRAVISFAGRVNPVNARRWAEQALADWPLGRSGPPRSSVAPVPGSRRVQAVARSGFSQVHLAIGFPAMAAGAADEEGLEVGLRLYTARLAGNLREAQGTSYGAEGWLDTRRDGGLAVIVASVDQEALEDTLELIVDSLERLSIYQPSAPELLRARADFLLSSARFVDQLDDVAGRGLELVLQNLPADFLNQRVRRVEALAHTDIAAATRRHLVLQRMSVVMVGDAHVIAAQAPALGMGPVQFLAVSH
jgi:zinc protease